ncbi:MULTISPECIES: thiamine ABC transporter ATP-binding protein [Glaesserella]|uniref:Thiamine ABC transporter ATP-binding protein n=1 Tax=Glaesserella australis TaxID=2094024 RepID=A0A328C2J9_9PAST|nr:MULTISPECIES: thiamine ABC transporter ATP-binding protein [Glaesserella]AUI66914.1 thiamine ABC transporter ATP-binding protein [Glaesserella sp. 15-184]RAL19522.1 thiamine ABC transporter ATP-binding protein [Glaesserella australis]
MINVNVEFDYPEMPMRFELNVKQGERIAIVGESGAGKSTLLNLIAGFERASRGEIWLNGENHFVTEPAERPVSMLFQDNNLFPHLTVEQNIGLGLVSSLRFTPTQTAQIQTIAEQMGIAALLNRRADQLSGGQKQRVALARTLLRYRPILLLDEPFSALDPQRRLELQQLVMSLCQQKQLTLLMVTHQVDEVKNWCNRVVEVRQGVLIY